MKGKKKIFLLLISFVLTILLYYLYKNFFPGPAEIVSIRIDPSKSNINFHWKDQDGKQFENIETLKVCLDKQNKKLIFATNGGMFDKKGNPLGLYIEDGKKINPLNSRVINSEIDGEIPNFYLDPNGVFYVKYNNNVGICKSSLFQYDPMIKFATQSGPMLIIDGKINPIFSKKSTNFKIRNGVGVLSNNELIFAISKNRVTFYDFANYFKKQGCINALYLDGFVSKAYIPKLGVEQLDGDLGVIIGITEN